MSRTLKFRAFNRDNNDTQMYHNVFPQGEERLKKYYFRVVE